MTVLRGSVTSWAWVAVCGALAMLPIGVIGYTMTAPSEAPKVDPKKYPSYDPVCDTGALERVMDGGGPVRYWGPDAQSVDCFRGGEDPFRKALPRAMYVTSDKLSSMVVPPGEWVVQIQPGLFISNIPPERRAGYSR